jgi:hypothetical protein
MAVLQLDQICAERTMTKIFKALDSLPSGLEATYQDTLRRIRAQREPDNTLGIEILQWISQTMRPLQIDELHHALAVEWVDGEDPPSDLDPNNLLNQEGLLDICGGLVIIESTSQMVRLAHFTIEEFFRNNKAAIPNGNLNMFKTCSVTLQLNPIIRGLTQLVLASEAEYEEEKEVLSYKFPFLSYACYYWGRHIREVPVIESDLETLCLKILNYRGLAGAIYVFSSTEEDNWSFAYRISRERIEKLSGLHFLAFLGIRSLVTGIQAPTGRV